MTEFLQLTLTFSPKQCADLQELADAFGIKPSQVPSFAIRILWGTYSALAAASPPHNN